MHKFEIFFILLLCGLPLVASEFTVNPRQLVSGKLKPVLLVDPQGDILKFSAGVKEATVATLPGCKFDFSQGGKIELEFRDEARQSNPFPRLLELGAISLHFSADPRSAGGNKVLKALVNGNEPGVYGQILIPLQFKADTWHSLSFTYQPALKAIGLQLDGGETYLESLDFEFKKQDMSLMLGGNQAENCTRGYSGEIRNVRITAPYHDAKLKYKAPAAAETKTLNGVPVRHVVVSAIKNRHQAFPGVTRMPNGDLAAVFREGAAHVCPYGRICITFSKDGGKNWSAPVAVADTPSDERDPSIHTLPDGRVLIAYGGWNSWMAEEATAKKFSMETAYIQQAGADNFGSSHFIFSGDNGKTWSRPIKVPAFAPHGPIFHQNKFYYPTLDNRNGKRQVDFYRGSADATQWENLAVVGESEMGNVGAIPVYEEPNTAVLPDGTLVTAIRVPSDGYMRLAFSRDQGKTWSEPVKTPVRGFPQHLLPLKDGRLLATYGYRYRPFGIRACLSNDGGKTWDLDHEIVIRSGGSGGDLGYPVSIELNDGEVLTVYYYITKERPDCFIEGAFYKP